MKRIFLFVFLFCLSSFAQQNPFAGKFSPTLDGLLDFSYTDYKGSVTRFGVALSGDYYLPAKSEGIFGFRLTASRFQISGEDPQHSPDRFKTNITSAGIGASFLHSTQNVFFKSVYAGVSYIWFDPLQESGEPGINNSSELYKKSSLAYDLSGGLKYLFTSSLAFNTSLSIHFLPHDNIDDITAGQHKDVFVTAAVGLTLLLGNTRDDDKDGITGYSDECPNEPEDLDGFEDDDGCPDPDNDGDGIPDHLDDCPDLPEDIDGFDDSDGCPDNDNDRDGIPDDVDKCKDSPEDFDGYLDSDGCPDGDNDNDGVDDSIDKCLNSPEDRDGFEDDDGCPDPDNDADGISDIEDGCPDIAEDIDGFMDHDGCPDDDNDNDGIADIIDRCPNEPETYNGYLDDDGCPDSAPEPEKKTEVKQPEVIKKEPPKEVVPKEFTVDGVITFYDDDYEIKPQAYADLNRIAELMKKDSTSRWRIEGHTDNVKPEKENLKLSQQRATEILLYFVKKGLRYPRLEAIGYGSKYPAADNTKPYGRAKNRRVVVKRVN